MIKLWQTYGNKAIVLLDQALVSGISFLLSVFLVRLLGIHVFGEFAIILIVTQGIVAINQSIVTSPFQSLFAQSQFPNYIKKLKGLQSLVLILFLMIIVLFEFVTRVFHIEIVDLPILLFSIYFVGVVLFDFNRKQLYLQKKYIFCLLKDICSTFGQLVFLGLAVYTQKLDSLSDVLLILGSCLMLVEGVVFFAVSPPNSPSLSLIKTHWGFGKWMLGNSILQWFSGNFFITTGALIIGAEVAGIIRIGQSIIGVWNVFIQALENYVPPVAALIFKKNGLRSLRTYLLNITVKGGVLISSVALVLVLFKNLIWETIYGLEFIDYTFILYWFGPILILNFLGFPLRFAIRTLNKTQVLFEAYVISSLLGFTTAHLFVYSFGIHGICLGLLLTQAVMQIWYSYRLYKFKKYENHPYSIG